MWFPPPVMVPCYMEPDSLRNPSSVNTIMWHMIPFDQHLLFAVNERIGCHDVPRSVEDGRIFLLNQSVFDLVKINHFLVLTDPRLLGWYLSLPAGDRKLIQEEGGFFHFLQRHPALEVTTDFVCLKQQVLRDLFTLPVTDMSSKLNKSRHPAIYGTSHCLNCGTSCPPGAKKCNRCNILNLEDNVHVTEEEKSLCLLPNSVKEELNLMKPKRHEPSMRRNLDQLSCIKSTSHNLPIPQVTLNSCQQNFDGTHPAQICQEQKQMHLTEAQYLSQLWKEGIWHDGTPQANLSLDEELDMQGYTRRSPQVQVQELVDTSGELSNLNQETSPEYYSLNTTGLEHTSAQWSDAPESHELGCNNSQMATKGSTEMSSVEELVENLVASGTENCVCSDSLSCNSSEWTDYTEEYQDLSSDDDLGCEPKSDEYHSVVNEGVSSLERLASNPSCSDSCSKRSTPDRVSASKMSLSVSQNEPNFKPNVSCKRSEATPAQLGVSQGVDATSDFRACFTSTQATEISQNTFEKLCRDIAVGTDSFTINCEQNIQTLQISTTETSIVTEVRMSDLDVLSEEFEYLKRTEEELKCIKDKMARSEALPDILLQTLKTLKDDYLKMKSKILSGIHLDDLRPLSVDTSGISTETQYTPALVYESCLKGVLLEETFSNLDEALLDQASPVMKMETIDGFLSQPKSQYKADLAESKGVCSKRSRAVFAFNKQTVVSGALKDINCSEAWFDAEEELGSDSPGGKEEKQTERGVSEMEHKGDRNGNPDQSSLLYVTDLPSNVTECDLLLWFERYHASQVSITTFGKGNRAAIVIVKSPSDAEAAVRDVNGQSIQDHVLHVEHIHRPPTGDQHPFKASSAELFQAACKAGPAGERVSSTIKSSREPLQSSLDRLINIYDKPTASGTCVPQHYATMGSFDTLMAQLSARHPEVNRMRIVKALLELRDKHQGFLSGLPLRAIADMTSDILAQQSIK
ncbi:RNA-binding protein 44 isoform X2 [Hoplias malabaricus]|uniref:RNA-binding protein 44 isoform X2 n=1 Tax=Hoplias malabaricus TaxID=27720 RepID=UPI00346215E6